MKIIKNIMMIVVLTGVCFGGLLGLNSTTLKFEEYDPVGVGTKYLGDSSVQLMYLTKYEDMWIGLAPDGGITEYNLINGILEETVTGNSIKMSGNITAQNNRLSKFYIDVDLTEGVQDIDMYDDAVIYGSNMAVNTVWGVTSAGLYEDGVLQPDSWGSNIGGLSSIPEPLGLSLLIVGGCTALIVRRVNNS